MRLSGKKILLGITGSIAAFKAVKLLRLLVKEGADVQVLLTPFAENFVTKGTIATLSNNPVLSEFFREDGMWNSHIELAGNADVFVIAPVTATTLSKMANGMPDNLLLATYLSCKCPVLFAPAMDTLMFDHPATKKNINILKSFGNILIEPVTGKLASGLEGKGRLPEPEEILNTIISFLNEKKKIAAKRILITAGPTYEPVDPVRFIGNHSSGKMGYAIAEVCAKLGAEVILISGPVNIRLAHPSIKIINVNTAEEMFKACMIHFPSADAAVLSAAVADFSPVDRYTNKLKQKEGELMIRLTPTKDIAAELGKIKKEKQILAGFALETDNEIINAREKMYKKHFNFIVLNSLQDEGAGFRKDTNKITIIDNNNNIAKFELKSKREVAADIVEKLITYF